MTNWSAKQELEVTAACPECSVDIYVCIRVFVNKCNSTALCSVRLSL